MQTYLYGKHNLYNALAGIAAVKILTNKPLSDIAKAMENFAGVSGRMEVVHTKPLVIVDFAHTYDGMKQIFESFRHQKIAVVFGAGGDRDKSKRPKMGSCAFEYAINSISQVIIQGVRILPRFCEILQMAYPKTMELNL